MQQPTRAKALHSLFLALACSLIVLVFIYLAVENSRSWAEKGGSVESPDHGAYITKNYCCA